jgi:CheY-like chemotaxis protein
MKQSDQIVLVVDDEVSMLRAAEAILHRGGYSPIAASGPREALKHSRDFRAEIHLLLTDITMPEMDGLTLAAQVIAERIDIRVLLMSGLRSVPSRLPFLKKPFRATQLLAQVANTIKGPPPLPFDVFVCEKPSEASVQAALVAAVDKARCRYLKASCKFMAVTDHVSSRISYPDRDLRIQESAAERQRAFENYRRAWKSLADHIAVATQTRK